MVHPIVLGLPALVTHVMVMSNGKTALFRDVPQIKVTNHARAIPGTHVLAPSAHPDPLKLAVAGHKHVTRAVLPGARVFHPASPMVHVPVLAAAGQVLIVAIILALIIMPVLSPAAVLLLAVPRELARLYLLALVIAPAM